MTPGQRLVRTLAAVNAVAAGVAGLVAIEAGIAQGLIAGFLTLLTLPLFFLQGKDDES